MSWGCFREKGDPPKGGDTCGFPHSLAIASCMRFQLPFGCKLRIQNRVRSGKRPAKRQKHKPGETKGESVFRNLWGLVVGSRGIGLDR